jgi:hypothetical protein
MGEFERLRQSSKNLPASNLPTLFPRFLKPRTTAGFGAWKCGRRPTHLIEAIDGYSKTQRRLALHPASAIPPILGGGAEVAETEGGLPE